MVLLYTILKILIEKKSDDVSMPVEWVWIIPTEFGDVVRSRADLREDLEDRVELCPSTCISIIPSSIPKSEMKMVPYSLKDLPDSRKSKTEVSNVCGFVAGFSSLFEQHPAWRNVRSTLGRFREAYSLKGGNLLFLRGKLVFKGATDRNGVMSTVTKLTSAPAEPVLKAYLIICTAYMRRNLFVHRGCLLEEMLWKFPWCKVMFRCGWNRQM